MHASTFIRVRQAREIKRAARHSWRIGRELTRYVVINFPAPDPGDELAPQRAFRAIRIKCASWWDYKRSSSPELGPLTDVRTWENCNGILHANWMVHVPARLEAEFDRKLSKWIKDVIGDVRPGTYVNGPLYNLNGLLNYVLKGTEEAKAAKLGIDYEDQGAVWGRRAVASIGLGKVARARDWQSGSVINTAWKYKRPSPFAPSRSRTIGI